MPKGGFTTASAVTPKTILFNNEPKITVGIVVDDTGGTAGDDGKKIIKAGTPVTGSLEDRTTPWTKTSSNDVVGVLLDDVDVTGGTGNATVIIFGTVDLNKVDDDVNELLTTTIKEALDGKVYFLK